MSTPDRLRADLAELILEFGRDLGAAWRLVAASGSPAEVLHDVLPALVDVYGVAAATVAAEWYDEAREANGIAGRYRAIAADVPDSGAHALVGWATKEATTEDSLRALIAGGAQRRILNFARNSVIESSIQDPRAQGWQRYTRLDGCDFCLMLAGRGAVYTSATANFGAHDDCNCGAAPKWDKSAPLVDVNAYRRSARRRAESEPDSAHENRLSAARDWIAGHL